MKFRKGDLVESGGHEFTVVGYNELGRLYDSVGTTYNPLLCKLVFRAESINKCKGVRNANI